ncbi:hypothetical protein Cob_v003428 [Colletotrichum orbiculare MAFF 240422]|uniref:Uncharacterized protein n=1 Tax=Colletotrichum orbiculare (strain 104-T / ATCC 96160 / CBS 514.97 / LARS 414 / MAFF 240422) TaxID=1213857 RepID=A0A484G177_COLOR|nr:hypothetical protein Cob_v003428 [Colletotrichum orbiculare MAFF 240422]
MSSSASKRSGFERAAERFKESLPKKLADDFVITTLESLKNEIKSIQKEHGAQGKLRNIQRASKFVEAAAQLGQVIEVFVNASEFVCFIWGPMKFLLGMAKTHIDCFDKLLEAYSQIGSAIPGLVAYTGTFQQHSTLYQILEDYYDDVLQFHLEAVQVFNRSKWSKAFHATWKTFNSQIGPILQSMQSRRELLESEKISASLYEIHSIRETIKELREEQTKQAIEAAQEQHRSRLKRLVEKLKAPDFCVDQEFSTENRQLTKTGEWIFKDSKYLAWHDVNQSEHSVLYLNGIPGAGKTTLVSAIVEKLLGENNLRASMSNSVSYFYFKQGTSDKSSHNSFLRAVLAQLLDQSTMVSQSGAKGMFLYARVVMENLLDQTRLTGLKREIQPNVFPAGINFAYERVVQRVLLTAPQPKRDEAAQLLGFIITARRDLRWREIQSFCCIKPATASVNYDDRLFVDSKQLCGSLVDTHHNDGCHGASESVIRMVHETAKRYLVERGLINESLANCRILNFCTEYLASTPFSMCLKPSVIAHHARSGYYGLQDYAIQYWYDHACLYANSTDAEGDCGQEQTLSLLANFLEEYALDVATFDTSPTKGLLEFVASDDRDRASHLNLEQRTFSIRDEIESLKLEDTEREVFNFLL